MIRLHRVDEPRNMRRYYTASITRDLFGQFGLERVWGRIGRRGQQIREHFASRDAAGAARRRIVRAKLRKRYRLQVPA